MAEFCEGALQKKHILGGTSEIYKVSFGSVKVICHWACKLSAILIMREMYKMTFLRCGDEVYRMAFHQGVGEWNVQRSILLCVGHILLAVFFMRQMYMVALLGGRRDKGRVFPWGNSQLCHDPNDWWFTPATPTSGNEISPPPFFCSLREIDRF